MDSTPRTKPIRVKLGEFSAPVCHYGDGRWAVVHRETRGDKRLKVFCRTEA